LPGIPEKYCQALDLGFDNGGNAVRNFLLEQNYKRRKRERERAGEFVISSKLILLLQQPL